MKTKTYIFIEENHASDVQVTAETDEECDEKYFMKYPERKEHLWKEFPRLEIYEGIHEWGWGLKPKE